MREEKRASYFWDVPAAKLVRVSGLGPYEEQQRYVVDQLARALGEDWVHSNGRLVDRYWRTIVALGYALPDDGPADDVVALGYAIADEASADGGGAARASRPARSRRRS